MKEKDFRRLALSLPETVESAHMAHPDFRVRNKIFATLRYPEEGWGMVALTPEDQHVLVHSAPGVFVPCNGAWGRRGATNVKLDKVSTATLKDALINAWCRIAPRKLVKEFLEQPSSRRTRR